MVFFFAEESDAKKCIAQFSGAWFDVRDKGRGPHGLGGIVARRRSN